MNVLITGGAGYIGYSLVNELDKLSEITEITVLDNLYRNQNVPFFTMGNRLTKTRFVKGDILNHYDLENVVQNQDVVIHMAAHVDFPYSYKDNYKYEQINQYGTVTLYHLLEKYLPKKVINLSSAAVYGFFDHVVESQQPTPENFYGISKLNAEKYLNLLQPKCQVYQLRSANVFGYNPQLRLDAVINQFFFDAFQYKKIKIHGTGKHQRPFIHIQTLVQEIQKFVLNDMDQGVYNLVEFNASMNEIRDFILTQLPDTEFTYLNSNSDFKTLSMQSEKLDLSKSPQEGLAKVFNEFQQVMRF